MPTTIHKAATSEFAIRARARRMGLFVQRCRSRNPRLPSFGMYRVIDPDRNRVVFGAHPHDYSATLEEVDAYLRE